MNELTFPVVKPWGPTTGGRRIPKCRRRELSTQSLERLTAGPKPYRLSQGILSERPLSLLTVSIR